MMNFINFLMYYHVWGILISAFIVDIFKNKLSSNYTPSDISPNEEKDISSAMKIKLDGEKELKVKYDEKPFLKENIYIKIQYCTS